MAQVEFFLKVDVPEAGDPAEPASSRVVGARVDVRIDSPELHLGAGREAAGDHSGNADHAAGVDVVVVGVHERAEQERTAGRVGGGPQRPTFGAEDETASFEGDVLADRDAELAAEAGCGVVFGAVAAEDDLGRRIAESARGGRRSVRGIGRQQHRQRGALDPPLQILRAKPDVAEPARRLVGARTGAAAPRFRGFGRRHQRRQLRRSLDRFCGGFLRRCRNRPSDAAGNGDESEQWESHRHPYLHLGGAMSSLTSRRARGRYRQFADTTRLKLETEPDLSTPTAAKSIRSGQASRAVRSTAAGNPTAASNLRLRPQWPVVRRGRESVERESARGATYASNLPSRPPRSMRLRE